MKNRNAAKIPTQHDHYAGQRIREARIALGMSQKALGELIGVSYQQLQKYENGKNRVDGARIGLMISALQRPFDYFYPSVTDVRQQANPVVSLFMSTKEGQALANQFPRIPPKARRAVLDLINILAAANHGWLELPKLPKE